jgi:hypothetical protein
MIENTTLLCDSYPRNATPMETLPARPNLAKSVLSLHPQPTAGRNSTCFVAITSLAGVSSPPL